jgi:serine phosphatase RsbU (regulator of sigma subunit)
MSACLLNMGLINTEKAEYDEAISYYEKSLNLKLELNDIWGAGKCYNNIGNAYQHKKEYKKSIEYFKKALEIKVKYEDREGIALVKASIAELFLAMANSIEISNSKKSYYYKESIIYGLEAYKLAKQLDTKQWIGLSSSVLSKSYKEMGSYKQSVKYLEIYIKNDSIMFSDEKTKAITEMEAKYKNEKKQLEIEKLEKDKELDKEIIARQEAENKKQNIILLSFIVGFILIFVFAIVIFYFLRQKRRANILLAFQKHEISDKNEELNQLVEEITTQRDEIETQRDEVVTQKEIIEKIHFEVSESIDYATKIQESILPEKEILAKFISEFFVLYKPKDKVSGDFYWWNQINGQTIITVADCTGHGVPGAFMSMLGVSFLREILQKEHITYPGIILKKLRKEIIKTLKQKDEIGGQKDGMDMSIISINHETNVLQYAGANNPLYIVKSGKLKVESEAIKLYELDEYFNFKLYEVKPNKMPISIYYKMDDFDTHEIQLEKGDQLYLFSDGYVDQFGGAKGRKFKSKAFKKLLLENADNPMQEQKEILNHTIENWKGDIEQIDDVTVMGIKI